jgi:hypothetical protein
VLDPEVKKLKEFYKFQDRAIKRFVEEVKRRTVPAKNKEFISQATLGVLGRMIGMFAVLNSLKNMKACLNNDFSAYRRCVPTHLCVRICCRHSHCTNFREFLVNVSIYICLSHSVIVTHNAELMDT